MYQWRFDVMRKLLGFFTISSLCLILGLGGAGCQKGDKFKGDKEAVTLDKEKKSVTVKFTKTVKSVDVVGEAEGVKAEKEKDKVTFSITEVPEKEKTAKFTVKGEGKDDEVKITVTVKGTGGSGEGKKEFAAVESEVTLTGEKKEMSVGFKHGEPDTIDPKEPKDGISGKIDGKKAVFSITEAPAKDVTVTFTVMGGKEKKDKAEIKVTAKASVAAPTGDDVKLESEELTVTLVMKEKAKGSVKIKAGKAEVEGVKDSSKENAKGVEAKIDEGKVWVIVEPTAAPGDYWVILKSTEKKLGAKLKVTVKAP
jgi:hypothetical protein